MPSLFRAACCLKFHLTKHKKRPGGNAIRGVSSTASLALPKRERCTNRTEHKCEHGRLGNRHGKRSAGLVGRRRSSKSICCRDFNSIVRTLVVFLQAGETF